MDSTQPHQTQNQIAIAICSLEKPQGILKLIREMVAKGIV